MGRFRDRMDEDLRIRGYSANTRASYLRCVRHFVRHFMRPPDQLTPEHIRFTHRGIACRRPSCSAPRRAKKPSLLCHGAGGQAGGARAFMLTCMKRPVVSSRGVCLRMLGSHRYCWVIGEWTPVSRGSVSLVFALVKGEGYSPAHEGIRGAGAPSIQRPCSSGHVNIRAHPPVEPARDHETHHTITIQSVPSALTRAARRPGPDDVARGGAHTPSHPGGAHRGCRPGGGPARRSRLACPGARRCAGPRSRAPRPRGAGSAGSSVLLE